MWPICLQCRNVPVSIQTVRQHVVPKLSVVFSGQRATTFKTKKKINQISEISNLVLNLIQTSNAYLHKDCFDHKAILLGRPQKTKLSQQSFGWDLGFTFPASVPGYGLISKFALSSCVNKWFCTAMKLQQEQRSMSLFNVTYGKD